ncbi:hypothetical protein P8605_48080, partial [Streptomyces sp. T-3]|nr:hypothetical protein [Streptomyces sp. T-3]
AGRAAMPCRLALLVPDVPRLVEALREYATGQTPAEGRDVRCADLREGVIDPLHLGALPETRDYLTALWRGGRIEQLTRLWLSGLDVDWAALEPAAGRPAAALPFSAFLRQPLWLTQDALPVATEQSVPRTETIAPRTETEPT